VDQVTDEIQKVYCKTKHLSHFDNCVLTGLGASAMRLQAVLGRSTTDIADAVRTAIENWTDTAKWFGDIRGDITKGDPTTEPPPQVARQLRTIFGIFRWLEKKAQGIAGPSQCSTDSYVAASGVDPTPSSSGGYTVDIAQVRAGWSEAQRLLEQAKVQKLLPENQLRELGDILAKEVAAPAPHGALAAAGENLRLARLRGLFSVYLAKASDAAAKKCVSVPIAQQAQQVTLQQQLQQLMNAVGATAVCG
jgi:hypothetical protein